MVFQNNVLSGASGSGTTVYAIDQSIRFNEADSPYMQKTYSGDGSRTTWSFSFWTKLGKSPPYNTTRGNFLIAYNTTSGAQEDIRIEGSNQQLQWFTHDDAASGILADLKTTQYLRDHSAWYHILCVADRTNAVASERQRMYINGQRVTDFATETYPSKDAEGHVGKSADVHYIGSRGGNSSTRIDGYMAEIHYLDGLAYDPSFFGEFNSSGIWIPKEYTGSYGTNGFKIDGRDASDLGDDESGNGNDFTTSGLSTDDKRSDSPTNNHATLNPLISSFPTYANGNLEASMIVSNKWSKAFLTEVFPQSGVWYLEGQEFNNVTYPATAVGIIDIDVETRLDDKDLYNRLSTPMSTFTGVVVYSGPGQNIDTYYFKNGSNTSTTGTPILSTSRLGFKYDADNNTFTVYDDGVQTVNFTSVNTGNYVFGVQQATGTSLSFRILVDAAYWTETPSGITSANALTSKNIGS